LFTNKKRDGIDTLVRAVSLSVAETPKASNKDLEPRLPIIPFGTVAYGFVGQPFSKQLYIRRVFRCSRAKTPIKLKHDYTFTVPMFGHKSDDIKSE